MRKTADYYHTLSVLAVDRLELAKHHNRELSSELDATYDKLEDVTHALQVAEESRVSWCSDYHDYVSECYE